MCVGPMNAPVAAKSLTSPAPVAPITCPGSISSRPTASPPSEAPSVRPLMPHAAKTTPIVARPIVSGFGTRRVHRSIAAPVPVPATTVAITIGSDGQANVPPEHRVDRVAERGDAHHRHDRDQRGEQSVFDQVLALVSKHQASDRRHHLRHVRPLLKTRSGAVLRPRV